MYTPVENTTETESIPVKKLRWPLTFSLGCIGLLLFLIVATIILALIPVYLTDHSVKTKIDPERSRDITMLLTVSGNSGRRRRASGQLSDAIGGTLTTAGQNLIRQRLLKSLPAAIVQDVVITSATLGCGVSRQKRRLDISKRATTNNKQIAFIVKAYIIYQPTCNDKCKTANAANLKSDIDAAIKNAAFNGIQIVINGEILDFTIDISVDDVLFMSDIVSDSDQNYILQPIPDMNTYVCNPNPVVETNTTTTTSSSSVFSATQSIG